MMSSASFTIAYAGPALRDGSMDVKSLAPALLAIGQLVDAANQALNHDTSRVDVHVKSTGIGSFVIEFSVVQTLSKQIEGFLTGEQVTAAIALKELVFGATLPGLFWLIKKLRGKQPDKIEKISSETVRLTVGTETIEVDLKLLRLYQDLAVRTAAQEVVEKPLQTEGIDGFEIRQGDEITLAVGKDDAASFSKPVLPDEVLIEQSRQAAFSIISLAFKEDNKWRLYDGTNQISALIEDQDFLRRVDANQIAFAKGDILLCEIRFKQIRNAAGLQSEYVVEKVIEHRPAARQLPLDI